MKRPRVTIGSLLALVLFLGIGLAALKAGDVYWDSALLGLTLALLAASALLAIHGRGARRAFWLGFVLVGSGYLWASLESTLSSRLPTSLALGFAFAKMPAAQPNPQMTAVADTVTISGKFATPYLSMPLFANSNMIGTGGNVIVVTSPPAPGASWGFFCLIGHSLFALLFAAVGGYASRMLHAREALPLLAGSRSDQDTSTSSPTSESDPAGSVDLIRMP